MVKRMNGLLGGGWLAARKTQQDSQTQPVANTWEYALYLSARRSARLAWFLAALSVTCTILSLTALVLLVPLKSYEPWVVEVDKTTGYMEIVRAADPALGTQDERIKWYMVVQTIFAHETYDATDFPLNYRKVSLFLSPPLFERYQRYYDERNPESPINLYGHDGFIRVQIRSISFPTPLTAMVRFATTLEFRGRTSSAYWVSHMEFAFRPLKLSLTDQQYNPFGFQVLRYRRDQEVEVQVDS